MKNFTVFRKQATIEEALKYAKENSLHIKENIFRPHTPEYYEFFKECRKLWEAGELNVTDSFDIQLMESDIGEFGLMGDDLVPLDIPMMEKEDSDPCWDGYVMVGMKKDEKGNEVPNCVPKDSLTEEEKKELNKPKRGGPKKFYVYVKDGDSIKKVSFGDTSGLDVKFDDPEARKSFVARHKCSEKKDKTQAGYWACRLPYYASELGLKNGGSFFW